MTVREQFSVQGMTCGNCVKHVEKSLQAIQGVSQVEVDLDLHRATVEYEEQTVTPEAMAITLQEAGYTMEKLKE